MPQKIEQKITDYKVINMEEDKPKQAVEIDDTLLVSVTYKFKPENDAYYMTITTYNNKPYSIFINSKETTHLEALGVLTTLLSMLFQANADINKLISACSKMITTGEKGYWGKNWEVVGKKTRYNSIYQEIGAILKHYITGVSSEGFETLPKYKEQPVEVVAEKAKELTEVTYTHTCPSCNKFKAILLDGCITCLACSYSKCG
jgi:ribonucleoside-diphosphate reductase alpha chain